ncbi:MAG: cryptochrome/photolyase family protein [Cyclobacteriaceae bacterium]|nr:cryptochrome/photolyase family protein [Cyclobacteriaceae bacterium]
MNEVSLVFPHQLFEESPLPVNAHFYLVEESLFFNQYSFHKQKLVLHRASTKYYQSWLSTKGVDTTYIESHEPLADSMRLISHLAGSRISAIHCVDVHDDWLKKRITMACSEHGLKLKWYRSPAFLNSEEDLASFFHEKKKKFLQNDWYIRQRKERNILLTRSGEPLGGKWNFDDENRKRYPKNQKPPQLEAVTDNEFTSEAKAYVEKWFPKNPGEVKEFNYPVSHKDARTWLARFLSERFNEFGPYEDAIVSREHFLHHSVLTPPLNIGLITPSAILKETLAYAEENEIPLNSTEGFVRQLIGWREFIRGIYTHRGTIQRTTNYWSFERKIPKSFYNGSTGILPVDTTIKKILKTGYCHHIERLMVLGNFMLLCEFDPDDVYRWFMEMFVDAYDWVMVPNVYGMSQFADGGIMATKPYFSGSNYLNKMSDFPKGDWQLTWDSLFWRFMHVHRDKLSQNHRIGMLIKNFDKMLPEKRESLLNTADRFLSKLT